MVNVWIGNRVGALFSLPNKAGKKLRDFPPPLMFDAVFKHKTPPPPPLFTAELPVYFRRRHRQIMHTADLPTSQPAYLAPATGNSCRPDPTLHSLLPAIPADRQLWTGSTPDPTDKTGNSCRPDPTLQSPSYRQYLPTGNNCRPTPAQDSLRPANIAANLDAWTRCDRQNVQLLLCSRLIYTGIRRAYWGGRACVLGRSILPEAPDRFPGSPRAFSFPSQVRLSDLYRPSSSLVFQY